MFTQEGSTLLVLNLVSTKLGLVQSGPVQRGVQTAYWFCAVGNVSRYA